jgi:hypothetical protein
MTFEAEAKEAIREAVTRRMQNLLSELAQAAEHRVNLHRHKYPVKLSCLQSVTGLPESVESPRDALGLVREWDREQKKKKQDGAGSSAAPLGLGTAAHDAGQAGGLTPLAMKLDGFNPRAAPYPKPKYPWQKRSWSRAMSGPPPSGQQRQLKRSRARVFPRQALSGRMKVWEGPIGQNQGKTETNAGYRDYTSRNINVQDLLFVMGRDKVFSRSQLLTKFTLQLERGMLQKK